jgi:hypothetical protein
LSNIASGKSGKNPDKSVKNERILEKRACRFEKSKSTGAVGMLRLVFPGAFGGKVENKKLP